MRNFAAIDFETANEQRCSVCSVGVVIVKEGEITDSYYSLIRPEPEYYTYWTTRVHGLTLADTAGAPVFPDGGRLLPVLKVCPWLRTTRLSTRVV